MSKKRTFKIGERLLAAALSEIVNGEASLTVDGVETRLTIEPSVEGLHEIGGKIVRSQRDDSTGTIWVHSLGSTFIFEEIRVEKGRRTQREPAAGSLLAPMPGKVVRVDVSEGMLVAAGAPLLILEAMKMEHILRAPHAGIVKKVAVRAGEMVSAGMELVEVERADEPG